MTPARWAWVALLSASVVHAQDVAERLSSPPAPWTGPEAARELDSPPPRGPHRTLHLPVVRAETPDPVEAPFVTPSEIETDVRATPRDRVTLSVSGRGDAAGEAARILADDLSLAPEVDLVRDGPRMLLSLAGERDGDTVELIARMRGTAEGDRGALVRGYRGPAAGVRAFAHGLANDALAALTGDPGTFGSRIVFARRLGPGRKAIFSAGADGTGVRRETPEQGLSMFPSFGRDAIWYSVMTERGVYITRTGAGGRPIVGGEGIHTGPAVCGDRLLFSSTRDGNAEIHSATLDGGDVRRLTTDPGIDVSPACGPDGRVAFVSDRDGRPQVFDMDARGADVTRLTQLDGACQTPVVCARRDRRLIAFTQVARGMRVLTLDLDTGRSAVISPSSGGKDPAFSPDCRVLAFATPQGVTVASVDGRAHRVIVPGHAETVRWSPR